MRRRGFLVLLLSLMLPAAARERSPDVEDVARRIVARTNELRRQERRQEVRSNDRLTKAALEFARFLSRSGKFDHMADGRGPQERAAHYGYDYCIVSENLGYQFNPEGFRAEELAREFSRGWANSPGHRKNLLHPEVTEIGVAVARGEQGRHYYAVQMFGRPQSDATEFKLANHTAAAVAYALGAESFSLPPGSTRTHRHCGVAGLALRWPGNQGSATVTPAHGDHYTIVSDGLGKYRLTKK